MRSEKDMYDLILKVANDDERIRAVYMNGSRANPNAPKDIFQDYDIVYVVTETASFLKDNQWLEVFGELLMMQEPDKLDNLCGINMNFEESYGYLMLFTDGNRIDLHIQTKEVLLREYGSDSETIPLLDKDGYLPEIPPANDSNYWIQKPTEPLYFRSCNNFWWCLQNVAKGIWRDELPYAKKMYECVIRDILNDMVSWWIGMQHDFKISTGKMGKYYKKYLPNKFWAMYLNTYSDGNSKSFWESIFVATELFQTLARDVANQFSFRYPEDYQINITKYLKQVSLLPADSSEFYDSIS